MSLKDAFSDFDLSHIQRTDMVHEIHLYPQILMSLLLGHGLGRNVRHNIISQNRLKELIEESRALVIMINITPHSQDGRIRPNELEEMSKRTIQSLGIEAHTVYYEKAIQLNRLESNLYFTIEDQGKQQIFRQIIFPR